ncbi:hypothetical protein FDECE_18079 [Fusarium decemcellulare]|nr:hypothetical protein FDECE_18079 [Fusarium decemcellulare]
MFRFVQLIRDNFDRLAASFTIEQGKTLADARGDVLRGIQVAEAAIAAPEFLKGELLEVSKDMETRTYREPLGVVAAICPFNFPAMVPLWCIPIATITGNTIILKPSERDPGATIILTELIQKAGFPNGVINVIHRAHQAVDFIIDEPTIKAISFISSNKVSKYIYTQGSANSKQVQANLGAKNHAAILPDANKNHFINSIIGGSFGAARQRYMALTTLITISPTVIANITTDMTYYKEEIFRPILIYLHVDTINDTIDLINKNKYGNRTAIFTRSGTTAKTFRKRIKAGQVRINVPIPVPLPIFSFTRNKKSIASKGTNTFYRKPRVNFYTQQKTVTAF